MSVARVSGLLEIEKNGPQYRSKNRYTIYQYIGFTIFLWPLCWVSGIFKIEDHSSLFKQHYFVWAPVMGISQKQHSGPQAKFIL